MDERFELNQRKAIREGWEDENFFLTVMFSSASQCHGSDPANSRIIRRLDCIADLQRTDDRKLNRSVM